MSVICNLRSDSPSGAAGAIDWKIAIYSPYIASNCDFLFLDSIEQRLPIRIYIDNLLCAPLIYCDFLFTDEVRLNFYFSTLLE